MANQIFHVTSPDGKTTVQVTVTKTGKVATNRRGKRAQWLKEAIEDCKTRAGFPPVTEEKTVIEDTEPTIISNPPVFDDFDDEPTIELARSVPTELAEIQTLPSYMGTIEFMALVMGLFAAFMVLLNLL